MYSCGVTPGKLKISPSPIINEIQKQIKFGKLNVCTYICVVKLEEAIQSTKFKNEVHKAGLNILYTAWWLKTVMSKELKEFGLTHEQYNVLRILKGKYPRTNVCKGYCLPDD